MTGAYIKIKRNNKWKNIEIDQLTATELDQLAADFPSDGWKWAKFLAQWIQKTIQEGGES